MMSFLLTKAHSEVLGENGTVGSLLENQGGPSKLRVFFLQEPRVVFFKKVSCHFFKEYAQVLIYFICFFHIVEILFSVLLL